MKILQVISNGYVCGGAEQSVLTLKQNLVKNGHEVRVLASDLHPEDPSTFSDYTYPHIVPGSLVGYLKRWWNPDSFKAVKRAVQEFQPDVIHFHTMGELSPSALFAAGKTPALLTVHGPEEYTKTMLQWFLESNAYRSEDISLKNLSPFGKIEYVFYRFLQRPLYMWAFRRHLTLMLSPSNYLAKELAREGYKVPVKQLYNGISLPAYTPLPGNQKIAYVGRLSYVKGVNVLIEAMAGVVNEVPKAHLTLIGDGPARADLEAAVKRLGLQKNITFLGWQKNDKALAQFKAAQLVVVPSIWPENLPTVCIEAMGVGRPVVGTNVGGIPELVQDGKSGSIVPPNNVPAISRAIVEILQKPQRAATMSAHTQQLVKSFTVGTFIKSIEQIYREVSA